MSHIRVSTKVVAEVCSLHFRPCAKRECNSKRFARVGAGLTELNILLARAIADHGPEDSSSTVLDTLVVEAARSMIAQLYGVLEITNLLDDGFSPAIADILHQGKDLTMRHGDQPLGIRGLTALLCVVEAVNSVWSEDGLTDKSDLYTQCEIAEGTTLLLLSA